jgi:hypothetical protein
MKPLLLASCLFQVIALALGKALALSEDGAKSKATELPSKQSRPLNSTTFRDFEGSLARRQFDWKKPVNEWERSDDDNERKIPTSIPLAYKTTKYEFGKVHGDIITLWNHQHQLQHE